MGSRASDFLKDKFKLFRALQQHDPVAIRLLSSRLGYSIKSLPGVYHFPKEDIEELRNDAILVTLKKMSTGDFVFQDYDPLSYAMGVAKRLFANLLRKKKLDLVPVEEFDGATEFSPDQYLLQKEIEVRIGELLKLIGENCGKVLRLKYFENLKDQEVVNKNLSPYSSVDSLKNKRSQCMKKLTQMVKEKGLSLTDFLN